MRFEARRIWLPWGSSLVLTLGICQLSWTYFEKHVVQLGHRFRYD
jgi:hypothetical protein